MQGRLVAHGQRVVVSILARPEGRALRAELAQPAVQREVSILARPEGRALRAELAQPAVQREVSILARPEGRALRLQPARLRGGAGRVSILARPEGRALLSSASGGTGSSESFQSSPGPRAGRYTVRRGGDPDRHRVSILARPEGRALQRRMAEMADRLCIVSILARPEGRALRCRGSRAAPSGEVSILARPEGRALPHPASPMLSTMKVSILARPEGRALHQTQLDEAKGNFEFQSSPGPRAGRYLQEGSRIDAELLVSILARPEGRALPARYATTIGRVHVSILARPEGRALLYKPPLWGARAPIIVDSGATCHAKRCLPCHLSPSVSLFYGKKVRGRAA